MDPRRFGWSDALWEASWDLADAFSALLIRYQLSENVSLPLTETENLLFHPGVLQFSLSVRFSGNAYYDYLPFPRAIDEIRLKLCGAPWLEDAFVAGRGRGLINYHFRSRLSCLVISIELSCG